MFGAEGVDGRRCAELAVWDSEWPADHWALQSRVSALPDAGRFEHKEPSFDQDCEPRRAGCLRAGCRAARVASRVRLYDFSVLSPFMSAGRATCRKRLAAVQASVGLLAGVRPLVRHNLALVGEPFWAD